MEDYLIKEWVKPELKIISFAKTSETVLNVSNKSFKQPIPIPPEQ